MEEQKNDLYEEDLKKAVFQVCLFIFIYYVLMKTGLDKAINLEFIKNEYWKEKIEENIIVIIIGISYYLLFYSIANFSRIVARPVKLFVELCDLYDGDDHTTMHYFSEGNNKFQSGVKITLNIYKSNSFWNWVVIKYLKNKSVEILVAVEPRNGNIGCLSDEYNIYVSDFGIKISEFLKSNLSNRVPFAREYNFLLEENRDMPTTGKTRYPIKPKLLINGKELGVFLKLFISMKSNLELGYYPIKFALHQTWR